MAHQRHALNHTLNAPIRVSIMAVLMSVDDIEFQTLRDTVDLTDSALSKQLAVLQAVDYIELIKGYAGKWPRTWVQRTAAGHTAFAAHANALQSILRGHDPEQPPGSPAEVGVRQSQRTT